MPSTGQLRKTISTPRLLRLFLTLLLAGTTCVSQGNLKKHALILFEGSDVPGNDARGDARELAMLLGHFTTVDYTLQGIDAYTSRELEKYDFTFFFGFTKRCEPPDRFLRDVYVTERNVVWLNTGAVYFGSKFDLGKRFGFTITRLDTASDFDSVKAGVYTFTKGEPNLNLISIINHQVVEVLATALSSSTHQQFPYMVRSGDFTYIADSPFGYATETDRYIFFADWLHDLLGEQHEERHRANTFPSSSA
jgi:uncharacterized protein YdaL